MQMQGIYLILIKRNLKQAMCSQITELQFLGVSRNKRLSLLFQIILRLLHYMKQVESVCGLDQ